MYRNEFKQSILKSTRDYALCETVMRAFDSIFEADLANTVSTTQQTVQGTTGATGAVPVDQRLTRQTSSLAPSVRASVTSNSAGLWLPSEYPIWDPFR